MRPLILIPALLLTASAAYAQSSGAGDPPATSNSAASAAQSAAEPQWGPVPSALPAGAQIVVLQGNPFGNGVYTLRLKMPNGYTVPPHFHPTDEMVTVISGTLQIGMGDQIDKTTAKTLKAGGFATAAAGMHHYAVARGEAIVQVHGQGPFAITYVNAKDDPRAVGNRNR
ncbi:MAG TPA: cupin domain-containing protein [Gemmatimonadaceae bacterium]